MVRSTVDVVERYADALEDDDERALLREAVLRYSREVAFAAAEVYAQAAETRGAWDARLESLVVDGVVRGEDDDALRSRAAALGWGPNRPGGGRGRRDTGRRSRAERGAAASRRPARARRSPHWHAWRSTAGGRRRPRGPAHRRRDDGRLVRPGPLVVGPVVDGIAAAGRSARAAISGFRAAAAWPDAPRPVAADDLLPERALAGDPVARRQLVDEVYAPLADVPARARHRDRRTSSRRCRSRRPRERCSCTRTRSATGCGGRRSWPATSRPIRGRVHVADGGRAGPAGRCAAQLSPLACATRRTKSTSAAGPCRVLHNELGLTWSASVPALGTFGQTR